MIDRERLERCLGGEPWGWFRHRLRHRLEHGRPLPAHVRNPDPSDAERGAAARLLGRAFPPGRALTLRPDEVARLLAEATICPDLPAALEALDGPLIDKRAARDEHRAAWDRFHAEAEVRLEACGIDPDRLATVRRGGLWVRLAARDAEQARTWLDQLEALVDRLETTRERRSPYLAELAAGATGDAHALDPGRPLSTLALHLLGAGRGEGAGSHRATWAGQGVRREGLSATVLALNLRPSGGRLAGAWRIHAEAGQPYRATLSQIEDPGGPVFPSGSGPVFVCENPTVVAAAAERLGASCPPLVCTEGQPGSACRDLLGRLSHAGRRLHYHGDFDWGGLTVAAFVHRKFGFTPWRYTAAEYRRVAERGAPLSGEPVPAPWDPDLAPTLTRLGRAVHEEAVLEVLLADLAASTPRAYSFRLQS